MENNIDYKRPAFVIPRDVLATGITELDYFAAKALPSVIDFANSIGLNEKEIAVRSYKIANEMLEARKQYIK